MHPRVREATLQQLRRRREAMAAGARHVGWKLAFGFQEIDAVAGGEATIGHLTSATVLAPGDAFDASGVRELRAETEIAVAVGAGGSPAGLAVAIELVDVARPPDDLEGIVAANVAHRACVIGEVRPGLPAGARARLFAGGELREQAAAEVDAESIVATAGGLLAQLGEALEPGDLVLAGALTHVPVARGETLVAEVDGLGEVSVRVG